MKITMLKSRTTLALIFASLLAAQTAMANGEEDPAKAKAKDKHFASLNNRSARIYPDAFRREVHVIAKGNGSREIDFFVFDTQGTLVTNHKMKGQDHCKLAGLAKGTYVYRIFEGDVETAAGKFEIR